jgi:hypothetical protein
MKKAIVGALLFGCAAIPCSVLAQHDCPHVQWISTGTTCAGLGLNSRAGVSLPGQAFEIRLIIVDLTLITLSTEMAQDRVS